MTVSRKLSEFIIVRSLANTTSKRLTRKVITALQRMTSGGLSGEDSGLNNIWEEICVQVQVEQSFHWQSYDATVRALLDAYVEELSDYEREALWLQTDEGKEWDCETEEEREDYPVFNGEIVNHLAEVYIYAEAARWNNQRIRSFNERRSAVD